MDSNLITVKALINRVSFKPVLINTGCEYYSNVDKDLIMELRFLRMKIPPNPVTGFIKENTKKPVVEITKITNFLINIQGYRRNISTYVVPVLLNPLIIRSL